MQVMRQTRTAAAVAAAFAAGLVATPAFAAASNNGAGYNNYIFALASAVEADDNRSEFAANTAKKDVIDTSKGVIVGFGHRLSERVWVEGNFFNDVIQTDNKAVIGTTRVNNQTRNVTVPSDFYHSGLTANLAYSFGQRSDFSPFVIAGVGAARNSNSFDKNSVDAHANAGVGFTVGLFGLDALRLRAEYRISYDDFKEGSVDNRASVGLEFGLGRTAPVVREVPVEKVVVREVPIEKVVFKEVTQDDDGDGVINDRDQCPNTIKGAKVDGTGCVVEQTITLRDITFEFNSSRLTANAQRLMENVVSFLRSDKAVKLAISGHTDSVASDDYNLKLSRDRANEVRDYLIGYGISPSRLEAAGFGETRPVASNDTAEGRELNRRVEFRIQK